jgi:hypothetical protein
MRLLRRTARPSPTIQVAPEFGVQVMLRKGDKVVRRNARGAIHITVVTEERVELTDLGHMDASPPRAPRRG